MRSTMSLDACTLATWATEMVDRDASARSLPIRDDMLHEGRLFFVCCCFCSPHLHGRWQTTTTSRFVAIVWLTASRDGHCTHVLYSNNGFGVVRATGGHSRCSHKNEMFISMKIPPSAMITITFTGMMATRWYTQFTCIHATCNTHKSNCSVSRLGSRFPWLERMQMVHRAECTGSLSVCE